MSKAAKETIAKKQPIIYSDFVNNLALHPLSNDIARITNSEAVKQSIKNLVLTNYGEKLFNPEIGSNLSKSLFEPLDGFTLNDMQDHIVNTITFHEPRANLIEVRVSGDPNDENTAVATIVFSLINTNEVTTLNLILRRVR